MIQILRIDNPLFAPGLSAAQRLCYFNAMTHFLYAFPRLIFLTSPLIYLVLGHTNIPGYWAAILAFAFPHLVLSAITNSRIQGQHRHSFWNEIYETVLAPYIFLPTMMALINPKLGSFNVTAKGGVVKRGFFDARIAQPFIVLLAMSFIGLLCAIPQWVQLPGVSWLWNFPANMYDGGHRGTIMMNVLWTLFNIMILGVATAVAWESQQRRTTVRVTMAVPANVVLPGGFAVQSVTTDLSSGGVMLLTKTPVKVGIGEAIQLVFPVLDGDATLPATVVEVEGRTLRAVFDPLTMQQEEALTMVLYSRADTWLGWGEARESDEPLLSMWRILQLSVHGLTQTAKGMFTRSNAAPKAKLATSIAPLLLLLALLPAVKAQGRPAAGTFANVYTLSDMGTPDTIVLRGVDAHHTVYFSVPQTQVVKTATMRLRYHFSPGLLPMISHLNVSLNRSLFATLPVRTSPTIGGDDTNAATQNSALLEATLTLPADALVHNNELTFEFVGHYTTSCEDPSNTTLWSHVDANSSIELGGTLLPLQNDLKVLPLPFYDAAVNLHPSVPIVFLSQPSAKALQAAGIVASWFGIMTDYHAVRFPVSISGTVPQGNAIVISENTASLPGALGVTASRGPTIAMRTNPFDPYSKLLVVTGDNADDLLVAAKVLTLQGSSLAGDMQTVRLAAETGRRKPDDAPRWLSTDRITTLGEIAQTGDLQGDSSVPVGAYFRIPPDLDLTDAKPNLAFQMNYRYNPVPLANESTLQMYMNGAYVSSTPMPHSNNASAQLETLIPVPVVDMRPFSNSMKMQFVFQIAKTGKCMDTAPMNLQGAILKNSYLDIRDIPHWAQMPNLELFANAGYPFTRMADLADTAVVMAETPSTEEIEMYLTLMGHFGAQTGYPVLNVTVTNADGMKTDHEKDYLLLGTADNLASALARVGDGLPVKVKDGGLEVEDTQGFFAPLQNAWWRVRSSDRVESGKLEIAGGVLPDALVEGIEWPRGSGKSVVLVMLRDKTVAPGFLQTFLKTSQSSDIAHSVSVLQGDHFVSYRIGNDVYHVGYLSPLISMSRFFQQFPVMAILIVVGVCLLMGILLRAALRRRARRRLLGEL
jgi:cellulose synthase (UDP-forming)